MLKLGVNIDHVATLRQARGISYPDPIIAARICEQAGANSIVCHLREDRRHIQDHDVFALRKTIQTRLNLEMSLNPDIIQITGQVKPDIATIVPERRQEITTEGGLDIVKHFKKITAAVCFLQNQGIEVSLFVAPVKHHIKQAHNSGATAVELHTGAYAEAKNLLTQNKELKRIITATQYAQTLGLKVSAGHGLHYNNTFAITQIKGLEELNIGHAIVSEAVFIGLENAVKNMLCIVKGKK